MNNISSNKFLKKKENNQLLFSKKYIILIPYAEE